MARTPDPTRKPALLAEIVDYLLDKPLATLSFRTVATGLGVSTYSLVYHFGNREQLMNDIVGAVMERQNIITGAVQVEGGDIDVHMANIRRSWQLGLAPRSRALMRLEFEAAMLRARESVDSHTAAEFNKWYETRVIALEFMGIRQADAEVEARLLVDSFYGLQFDLLVTRDDARATTAFERAAAGYESRIRVLIAEANEMSGETENHPVADSAEDSSDGRMGQWPPR